MNKSEGVVPPNRLDSLVRWAWSAYPARAASIARKPVGGRGAPPAGSAASFSVFGPYPTARQHRRNSRRSLTDSTVLARNSPHGRRLPPKQVDQGVNHRDRREGSVRPPGHGSVEEVGGRTGAGGLGQLFHQASVGPAPEIPPGRRAGRTAPKPVGRGKPALSPGATVSRRTPRPGSLLPAQGLCPGRQRRNRAPSQMMSMHASGRTRPFGLSSGRETHTQQTLSAGLERAAHST